MQDRFNHVYKCGVLLATCRPSTGSTVYSKARAIFTYIISVCAGFYRDIIILSIYFNDLDILCSIYIKVGLTIDKPNGFLVHLPSRVESLGGNVFKFG